MIFHNAQYREMIDVDQQFSSKGVNDNIQQCGQASEFIEAHFECCWHYTSVSNSLYASTSQIRLCTQDDLLSV